MKEQLSEMQKELRRNRIQSYIFLILLVTGVLFSLYLYMDLQHKKEELAKNYQELKDSKDKLARQDSVIQRQKVMNEVIAELKVLVDSDEMPNDKETILRKLQEKAKAETEVIEDYNQRRGKLIRDLFSNSESIRKQTTDDLLKEYSDDDQFIPELLAYSKGKVKEQYQESVWQVIYILEKLDRNVLQPEAESINKFIADANAAALVGPSTKTKINSIKNKL